MCYSYNVTANSTRVHNASRSAQENDYDNAIRGRSSYVRLGETYCGTTASQWPEPPESWDRRRRWTDPPTTRRRRRRNSPYVEEDDKYYYTRRRNMGKELAMKQCELLAPRPANASDTTTRRRRSCYGVTSHDEYLYNWYYAGDGSPNPKPNPNPNPTMGTGQGSGRCASSLLANGCKTPKR